MIPALHRLVRTATVVSAVLGVPAAARAQPSPPDATHAPPTLSPAQTQGSLARWVVGPMGHVRGFVLDNGAVVMLHGRDGDALAGRLQRGAPLRVDGRVAPANPGVIFHATVRDSAGILLLEAPASPIHERGAWGGPRGFRGRHAGMQGPRAERMRERLAGLAPQSAQGTVAQVLTGPRGRVRGFLLAEGTSVFLPPGLTHALGARVPRAGESVTVSGRGGVYPSGTSVLAQHVVFGDGATFDAPPFDGPAH